VEYRNVKKSAADLDEMLRHTKGGRKVPVMLEDGRVTVGFGGT
jgi:glutaredoxin 3